MIRFGVLGAGRIAHSFSAAASGIGEHLYAIASRDLAKAVELKNKYHYEVAYGSYQAMLADPLVDCVYIATPHALHYEQMIQTLQAGKHILCEKAFTLNANQAKNIFALAAKKKLFVMEAMWTRFLPTIQEVVKTVEKGDIGDVIQLDATFSFLGNADPEKRLANPALGGGALLDVGIYPITMANLILGSPTAVESEIVWSPTGVDLANKITYLYPESEAFLQSGFIEEQPRDAYIYGTTGYIQIPHFNGAERAIVFDRNHKIVRVIEHKHLVNGMEYEIFETVRCIKKKLLESAVMTHETTLEILRQMDEIRRQWNLVYPHENESISVDLSK
jgi:dihydrodiol dehydrogenase / D-xylose 1-dehydrogenase (NADP)